LSQGNLRLIEIPLPPLPIQQRIAGILSAYDELIENCQRRIKILESIARALYREWFVHFRFPGHENHPRVASPLGEIPQGWEVRSFSNLASYVNGYPFKPAQLGNEGIPIIKIKELKAGIVADTPRNLGDEIPYKYTIHDGYVLFSWSADLDTYLWTGGKGLLNQHLFNVVPFEGISRAFCFHALKESMPRFRALSLGATMHHIKRSALDQVFTLLPPEPLRKYFEGLVEPMHHRLITLTKHVANLRRTRDLLLPRLLSGQIDVTLSGP
jgi:type I restriction enzyme S subunit